MRTLKKGENINSIAKVVYTKKFSGNIFGIYHAKGTFLWILIAQSSTVVIQILKSNFKKKFDEASQQIFR